MTALCRFKVRFLLGGEVVPADAVIDTTVTVLAEDPAHAGVKAALALDALGIVQWSLVSVTQEFTGSEVQS